MFHSARIKLTAWYLVIIMAVSISFSAFIYQGISTEFERSLNAIETRLELRRLGFLPPPGQEELFIQDLEEAKEGVLIILVYTNIVIFVFSALFGYFLAGRTLKPIELSMEEQKRFVADASHEFKTPLTSLQTSIEVALRDKKLNLKEAKELLADSLNDVQNLNSLSNNLLGLSRFQNDDKLSKEKVNITEIVNSAVKKMIPIAKNKKIKIEVKTKKIMMSANRESLDRLFTILLDNAIKYSDKDKIVKLSLGKSSFAVGSIPGKSSVIIEIKDQGFGIPKKEIPHIFDRFYRVDVSRSKEQVSGFGLGLSMAKEIVDLHKGVISVRSNLGKGSTFRIILPI